MLGLDPFSITSFPVGVIICVATVRAVEVIAERDFTHVSCSHNFRIDLVALNRVHPRGMEGAIFRLVMEDPETGHAVRLPLVIPKRLAQATMRAGRLLGPDELYLI